MNACGPPRGQPVRGQLDGNPGRRPENCANASRPETRQRRKLQKNHHQRGLQRGAIGERFFPGQQGLFQLPLETATTNAAKG